MSKQLGATLYALKDNCLFFSVIKTVELKTFKFEYINKVDDEVHVKIIFSYVVRKKKNSNNLTDFSDSLIRLKSI